MSSFNDLQVCIWQDSYASNSKQHFIFVITDKIHHMCGINFKYISILKKKYHIHISLVLSRSIYLFFIIRYVHNLVYA